MYKFNVRVYGLLFNEQNQILISDEEEYGFQFSKFPGGGLEYGEGLIDGLIREFMEECNAEIEVLLREALAKRGVKVGVSETAKRGRPPKES